MKIPFEFTEIKSGVSRLALSMTVAAGLLALPPLAYADAPLTMAPPVQPYGETLAGDPAYVTPNSVFNWNEVPQNQQVFITRAVFDRGGYQLYDTAGETIVVPFTNDNLYVMKFARTNNGRMYFVNAGNTPVLYVPGNGYLENATVSGARWFPFGGNFRPAEPVYMGIAPSWPDYVDMGWYPGMICSGGYYSYYLYGSVSFFQPTIGLLFVIGGNRFHDFDDFRDFHRHHPTPFRTGFRDPDIYRFSNHQVLHRFDNTGRPYFAHRSFQGVRAPFNGNRTFSNGQRPFYGNRAFSNGQRPFYGNRTYNGSPAFQGDRRQLYEHRTFQGAQPPVFQQRTFPNAQPQFNGNRTFPSAPRPFTGNPGFSGNRRQIFEQRTFPSGQQPMTRNQGPMVNRGMGSNQGGNRDFGGMRQDNGSFGGDRGFGGSGRMHR